MKELSCIVEIYPISTLPEDFHETNIGKKTYSKLTYLVDPFTFEPLPEESTAGTIYDCSQELTGEKLSEDAKYNFNSSVSCVIRFRDTESNNIIVGTRELPAQVIITPFLSRSKININCKMLHSPY